MWPAYTTLINLEALADIQENHIVFLDCRYSLADASKGRKDYLQSHIPGAFYLDIGHDLSSPVVKGVTGRHPLPDPEIIAATFRAAGIHKESQVVAYDQSNGAYASRCWWILQWLGHEKVAVLNGGFDAWRAKQLPVDNQWPQPGDGTLQVNMRNDMITSMDAVVTKTSALIDSRDFKRYTGEVEPIDPVAGHIPGAICLPYMDNTDEKGYWKSIEHLQAKFKGIQTSENNTPVFYCGSGVTACHNILAYKIATKQLALLYPGSYSEWINYHTVVTGDVP